MSVAGAVAGTVLGGVASTAGWKPISESGRGGAVLGVLNGLAGDRLEARGNELALTVSLRHDGSELPLAAGRLKEVLPEASGDVVVFLHGLVETDRSWWWGARRYYGDPSLSYGIRLPEDLGITPLYLRHNTGLPVGANGRRLDELLEQTVEAWPVPIERLSLVGHSMGWLVIPAHAISAPPRVADGSRWSATPCTWARPL